MVALYGATSFLGAALLFLIEPMLAKLVLPYFGGSPMVWTTCTLFFQVLLLLGYLYVHLSTRMLGSRAQPYLHLGLLVLPLLVLPVALPDGTAPPDGAEPTLWLLRVLAIAIGLPFALLAMTGPVLQRWFSWTGHRRAADPYFLFAASNAGSVVGLLGYPFLVEPQVGLETQTQWWSAAYIAFAMLLAVCGAVALVRSRARRAGSEGAAPAQQPVDTAPDEPPSGRRRLGWVAMAFIPSSLMLGVTTYVSTDIAAIPMFWTIPLAAYLATFVAAFGRTTRRPPQAAAAVASALAILALLDVTGAWNPKVWVSVSLQLLTLVATGVAAHGRLAVTRPSTSHLTGFYLLVALGGAAGGLLNGFVAPVVLDRVLEYPLVLALVPLLMVGLARPGVRVRPAREPLVWVACLLLVGAMGSVFLRGGVLLQERTFYGSYRVVGDDTRRVLNHGTTTHGWQYLDETHRAEPTAYFTQGGPAGDVMAAYGADPARRRIAVVGVGVGTLAAYGRPEQRMDFYEIDPEVVRIARDSGLFTYLDRSEADVRVIIGDGRLQLARAPDGAYGMIVLDAFSSDAIPAHLMTEEALGVYRRKLAPGGVLVIHITNRHLELGPVLASQAGRLGMTGLHRRDPGDRPDASRSHWVVLAADPADLDPLRARRDWRPLQAFGVRPWTDDYSSLFEVLEVGWP